MLFIEMGLCRRPSHGLHIDSIHHPKPVSKYGDTIGNMNCLLVSITFQSMELSLFSVNKDWNSNHLLSLSISKYNTKQKNTPAEIT